jgi:hypothetical protein
VPRLRREKANRFRRADGVEVRKVGTELFLIAPGGAIHQLDQIATGTWRALSKPRTADEIIALFQVAFPLTPKSRIAKDITKLLRSLEETGLILSGGALERSATPD